MTVVPGSPARRRRLPRLAACILAVGVAFGGAATMLQPSWRLVAPALADDDGGGDGGSSGSGGGSSGHGGGGGDDGNDNSGPGSANSGRGNGGGDDDDGHGGGDDDGDGGDDDGHGGGSGGDDDAGERAGEERDDHGDRDYVLGEVVVANMQEPARGELRRLGFVVVEERRFDSLGLTVARLRVPRGMTEARARTLLASRFPDMLVDLNVLYRPQAQLTLPAPDYPQRLIGWGQASDGCGAGLRIGMLDTAVDQGLPALRDAHIAQRSFLSGGTPAAGTQHGTAIATILVGQGAGGGQGLLPGAELSVAEVFARDSAGAPAAEVLALVGGLDWLVDRGVPVINLSLAGDANALVSLALRRAAAAPAVLIAAAGNGGPTAAPAFPAAEPAVIGVTAVDSRMQPYDAATPGDHVDFAAPGVRIWTPGGDGTGSYNSGTSFATPYVAAAAAAAIARERTADAAQLAATLAAAALDLGAGGKDPVFGWGLVQSPNPCGARPQ